MEIFVKKFTSALVVVFTMKLSNNVFVNKVISGMVLPVWFNLNVVVEKDGIKILSNVNVQAVLIGIIKNVFNVFRERFGMSKIKNVFV